MNKTKTTPEVVYCQVYLEADEFFGDKPDGFSVHLEKENLEKYAKPFQTLNRGEATYTDGKPFEVPFGELPKALAEELLESPKGMVRVFKGQHPTPTPPPTAGVQWQPTGHGSYGHRY